MFAIGRFLALTSLVVLMVRGDNFIEIIKEPGTCMTIPVEHGGTGKCEGATGPVQIALDDDMAKARNLQTAYHVKVDHLGDADIKCYWVGHLTDRAHFYLANSASYLWPCGPKEGVTMVCKGPEATCKT